MLHFIFHCNISVGAIFSGSLEQCRAYILSHPSLMVNAIICDEDEYEMLRHMPEEQIRKYFANLRELAKDYKLSSIAHEIELQEAYKALESFPDPTFDEEGNIL